MSAMRLLNNLEVLEWLDEVRDADRLLHVIMAHQNIRRLHLNNLWLKNDTSLASLAPCAGFSLRHLLIRSLNIEPEPGPGSPARAWASNLANFLGAFAPTLETLSLTEMGNILSSMVEPAGGLGESDSDRFRPLFLPRLRRLHLYNLHTFSGGHIVNLLLPDASHPLQQHEESSSSSSSSSCSTNMPRLHTLEIAKLRLDKVSGTTRVLDFVRRQRSVRKLAIQVHGHHAERLHRTISGDLLCSLTSLTIFWVDMDFDHFYPGEGRFATMPNSALATVGSVTTLEQLAISVIACPAMEFNHEKSWSGFVDEGSDTDDEVLEANDEESEADDEETDTWSWEGDWWGVDHDSLRAYLSGLQCLKRLLLGHDWYGHAPSIPSPNEDAVMAAMRPDLDAGLFAETGLPRTATKLIKQMAFRNKMLSEAELYARAMPALDSTYLGRWYIRLKDANGKRHALPMPMNKGPRSRPHILDLLAGRTSGRPEDDWFGALT